MHHDQLVAQFMWGLSSNVRHNGSRSLRNDHESPSDSTGNRPLNAQKTLLKEPMCMKLVVYQS